MKRAHRKAHLLVWLLIAPVLGAIIYLAVVNRPEAPVNPELPAELILEDSQEGI